MEEDILLSKSICVFTKESVHRCMVIRLWHFSHELVNNGKQMKSIPIYSNTLNSVACLNKQ